MALKPEHRQEEWYQQMINAATGKYLPSITAQDAGKVMTVESDGSWGVENVPTELPAVETTDKDKYLHTNASTGAVEWSAAPTELPSVSGTDEGKVLTVNNSGVWGASIRRSVDITNDFVQVIEATVDGSLHFSTDVTPNDIINGYTAGTKVNPKFEQSVSTMLSVSAAGLTCVLYPTSVGDYGISFLSEIFDGALVGASAFWIQIDVTAVQSDQAYNVYMRQFDKSN